MQVWALLESFFLFFFPFRIAQEYLEHVFFCISQEALHLFYLPALTEYSEHKGGHLMNLMNQSIKENFICFP